MKVLVNNSTKTNKDQKFQEIIKMFDDLKLDSVLIDENTDQSDIDELMKIENFNGSIEEIRKELQIAYTCLFKENNN